MKKESANRRDFLSGQMVRSHIERTGEEIANALSETTAPSGGDTLRLTTRAMACDFSVIMNPSARNHVMDASSVLDLIHELENQLTVYSEDSEVSSINRLAVEQEVEVESQLFQLLGLAQQIHSETNNCFDLTAGPLIALWRKCREAQRIPTDDEINECLRHVGMEHLVLSEQNKTIRFLTSQTEINLGAIGKGYALDRAGELTSSLGINSWLLHGGHSSVKAFGDHNGTGGWPVGLGNPLFTKQRLGTLLLKNQAMSTSGSNIQYFRCGGKRFGHILNPKTGWPAEGTLSVTVLAPSAALADALSTAFFVGGEPVAREYCASHSEIGAILIPFPHGDRRVEPTLIGVSPEQVFWDNDQIRAQAKSAD